MMDKIMSVDESEFTSQSTRIDNLLNKLKRKLKNFAVLDSESLLVGHVVDVILHSDYSSSLVVSQPESFSNSHHILVNSKLIQEINTPERSLIADISHLAVKHLPKYSPVKASASLPRTTMNQQQTPDEFIDESSASANSTRQNVSSRSTPVEWEDIQAQEVENYSVPTSPVNVEVVEEELIRLLEERLIVNTNKQKVGEVIVRKTIETQMVEVPVRREKLIVEQVSPDHKQLAEIDLSQGSISGLELLKLTSSANTLPTVQGEFGSLQAVRSLLDAIAKNPGHGCAKIKVEMVLEIPEDQAMYQECFDRVADQQNQIS
jgi:hypothetical protein